MQAAPVEGSGSRKHAIAPITFDDVSPYSRARVYQDDTRREIQQLVEERFARMPPERVLDAGCGFELSIDFPLSVHLVGVDGDGEALAKNENVDEAIVGDVETYDFGEATYDAVVCWTVLEHLRWPEAALQHFVRALRPGGLLIIGVPNIWSIKGLATKVTPHRFHVWAYRHLLGDPEAGKPGMGPYKTYLKRSIAPGRLAQLARANQLELVYSKRYGSPPDGLPRAALRIWNGAAAILRLALLGKIDPNASEYAVVFKKAA